MATALLALVKDKKIDKKLANPMGEIVQIKSGTVLEGLAGSVRDVPTFGKIGPFATGSTAALASHLDTSYQEIMQLVKAGWGRQ